MNEVRLPALSGGSPLGILAAIGLLRLLTDFTDDRPRLSWSRHDLTAVLHTRCSDVEAVTFDLAQIIAAIPTDASLPGVPRGFPPEGAAPDRLRVPQTRLRVESSAMLERMTGTERDEASRWLASLVTDLAKDAQQGRVAISQFAAPSGKQSMSTMLVKPLEMVRRDPDYLRQGLSGWRRVTGVTGEYLDHRAMWDAAEAGDGASGSMRGIPGATWLALMSYPLFRTTERQGRAATSGWHAVSDGRRRYDELRLPVWEQPLGTTGVTVLIEHPALVPMRRSVSAADDGTRRRARRLEKERSGQLDALGIIHVCRARRRQPSGSKSAGVLTTIA